MKEFRVGEHRILNTRVDTLAAILQNFLSFGCSLTPYYGLIRSSGPGTRKKSLSRLPPNVLCTFSKMEADLYDEFGNYIGPELESDEESEEEEEADEEDAIEYVSEVVLIEPQRKQTVVKL